MLMRHRRHSDQVKVLDFGLAKQRCRGAHLNQSDANTVLGTPLYMSPEAVLNPEEVDAQSDLYALGAVAYWLLSGATPYSGNSLVELVARQLSDHLEPPSKHLGTAIPEALEKLVLACLAKKKTDRPVGAPALVEALRRLEVGVWTPEAANGWWRSRGSTTPASRAGSSRPSTLRIAPRVT
jgi:serine/threonine protein kinase